MIVKGQIYKVIYDSDRIFKSGDLVVATEDCESDKKVWCVDYNEFQQRKNKKQSKYNSYYYQKANTFNESELVIYDATEDITTKRVYISGAITGCDDFLKIFESAEKELESKGYSVINPAKLNTILNPKHTTHEEYMRMSFELLDMADCIYMLSNWKDSRGANQEFGFAYAKNKQIMYQE